MESPRRRRPHVALLPALLLAFISLPHALALGQGAAPTPVDAQGQTAKDAGAAKPAGSPPLKDWLPFVGSVTAAVIAGLFAILQLRRSTAAQRALEREKLVTARTEAELAQVRSATREYRQAQALPFLEQLDKTLNESYKTAYFPPYFPDLGGYVPQLRRFSDQAIGDWLTAAEEMSRHRIRLLLVLSQERVGTVTALLTQFMELMKQILETRNKVWFQQATQHDLWEVQRSYVRVGYRLMMEIRDAVSSVPTEQTPIPEAAKESLAESLSTSFEKASAVSIPYGSSKDFCWMAIWEIDTRPDVQQYLEAMTKTTRDEFEEKLKTITSDLYKRDAYLDVKLMMSVTGDLKVACLAVSFAGAKRLKDFLDSDLDNYRQTYAMLWTSYRAPREIVVGLGDAERKGHDGVEPPPQTAAGAADTRS